jgi:hypothetical protein
MAQVYSMDSVIRVFDAGSLVPGKTQKVVMIDVDRCVVVPRKPFFRDVRSYLVSNMNDAGSVGTGAVSGCQLPDLESPVAVSAKFDARCRPGNEAQVALALFDPTKSPGKILEEYLTRWLRDMGQDRIAAFIEEYFDNPRALEAKLAERARSEIGLDMHVLLTLDAEPSLNTIIVSEGVLVTVRDFDNEEQYVEIKAGLEVDELNKTEAIRQSNRYDELHKLVPAEVIRFIRQNVTMQMFSTQLNESSVREPLIRHLNVMLSKFGRKIDTFTLESDPPKLKSQYQDDIDVYCRLHQYPNEVRIRNTVQMNLVDLARYKAAKAPPLKEWLQEKLEQLIPQLLFEARYIEVLLRFDPYRLKIKQTLAEYAAAIGYQIKQFVTVPDLEPLRWQEPFPVRAEGSFATQQSGVFVKLELFGMVRIPKLEAIEKLLNLDQDVPALMPKAILEVVEQFLHGCDPERFYMRFNYTDKPKEVTVEQAIKDVIKSELVRQFKAQVISVVVKMADAEPQIRLRALQGKISSFEVRVDTVHANAPLIFGGTFQVEAVDEHGWDKFQMLPATLDEVRHYLEDHLSSELQTEPIRDILFRIPGEQQQLVEKLRKSAESYVRRQFGLAVNVDSIRREMTPWERAALQVEIDKTNARLTIAKSDVDRKVRMYIALNDEREAQVLKLLQERTRLTLSEATDEEIDGLDKKIAEAQKKVVDEPIPSMAVVQAAVLPERSGGNGRKEPELLIGATEAAESQADQPRGDAE